MMAFLLIAACLFADSKMAVVESGSGKAGQWLTEECDVCADGWYGDILLSTEQR